MDQHPASLEHDTLLKGCRIQRLRRSGPGGQRRNKVETCVRVTHIATGLRSEASERRSQAENLRMALERLRLLLALQIRMKRTEIPSPLWQSRLRGEQISVRSSHQDFPSLIAEALDILAEEGWDLAHAARKLRVSTSQLVKLLRQEPRALQQLNQHRQAANLGPLT